MKRITCCCCEKALKKDEIALSKKLIDVDTEDFYCLTCMAEYFGCEEDDPKNQNQGVQGTGLHTIPVREVESCWKIR